MPALRAAGVDELCDEWRLKRDGRDCIFNVVVNVAEGRGLRGLGATSLNECKLKIYGLWDPEGFEESKIHTKTSNPFFECVSKLTYRGQPRAFFESVLVIEVQHDRGLMPGKLVGQLQVGIIDIFHSTDHKIPTQWFAISDIYSEEPVLPTGYIRCSIIINCMDEPGAVQPDVPEEERTRCELMQIPRMHTSLTATGVFNIIFRVFQARELKDGGPPFHSADPYIKIVTATGENRTDTKSDRNPVWNQQLQIPMYEPFFRQLISVQLWNASALSGDTLVAQFCMSWKDIFTSQEVFKNARWYDMFALPETKGFQGVVENTGKWIKGGVRKVGNLPFIKNKGLIRQVEKLSFSSGAYQERSDYCGRVLLAVEIEDREGMKAPPSLATTDMKPKDCKLFLDIKQKIFFRFHVLQAQMLHATHAQVELTIGSKSMVSKAVPEKKGMFEFFEALETEEDFAYDDKLWPWSDADYEDGWFPSDLIDCAVPACWLRVYRCNTVADAVGLNQFTRELIGFKRMSLRELLAIGDRPKLPETDLPSCKSIFAEQIVNDNQKTNVLFNMKESSLPAFYVPSAEQPAREYNPNCRDVFRPSVEHPPWPQKDDGRGNENPLDPYRGMLCVNLERDASTVLGPHDLAGFVWISLKMYLPSRKNCATPHRGGPPILSPFTKYNAIPIPRPDQLKCTDYFGLRVHVYQAKDLPSFNPNGVANAFVEVRFCGRKMKTHTVHGSNSPTWDETLGGRDFNEIELPCLGWPGQVDTAFPGQDKSDPADWKYSPKDEDWDQKPEDVDYAARWMFNYCMLRMAPRIEVRVMESNNGQNNLLGRCFIRPEICFHTQTDPEWYELFDGFPEQDEGNLYMGVQLIHCKDPLYKVGAGELIPQRTDEDGIARAVDDEVPGSASLSRKMWNPDEGILASQLNNFNLSLWMQDRYYPLAFFDRNKMPCAGYAPPVMLAASEVVMRECRVQLQILGLRNILRDINLTSPSLHVFIQTTEQWNADESSYKYTKDKSLPLPHEVNFKEQVQLEVLLPDDPEYAPNLEFYVMDKQGIFMPRQEIMCWGTVPLRDFYPQGEKPEELEEAEDEEDEATRARREKAEKRVNFEKMIGALLRQGTVTAKQAKNLMESFKATQGKNSEIERAFDLYLSAPSDSAFIQRTEDFLLRNEKQKIQETAKKAEEFAKVEEEKRKKRLAEEKEKAAKEKKAQEAEAAKEKKEQEAAELKKAKEEEKAKKAEEAAEKKRVKEEEKAKKAEEAAEKKRQMEEEKEKKARDAAAAKLEKDEGSVGSKRSKSRVGGGQSGGGESGGAALSVGASEGGVFEEEADAGPRDEGDAPDEEMEEAGSPEPGKGPGGDGLGTDEEADGGQAGSDAGHQAAGPDEAGAAHPDDVQLEEANGEGHMDVAHDAADVPGEGDMDEADKGPADGQEVGNAPGVSDIPITAGPTGQTEGDTTGAADTSGPTGSGQGGGGGGDAALDAIRPEDDEEPDRQEVVDTPDGKPTAEWLVFRKHTPYLLPLEETEEWGDTFQDAFDEVPLFRGRIKDYKRRTAGCVGILKCKIKIFRKEDETLAGKAKADNSRDPEFYEVGPNDPSIMDALESARPYRMYNIYETYPEALVQLRAYCLRAFQVTPGGFLREEDGQPVFMHYLRATLGDEVKTSHVVSSLNPNFFWVARFDQCLIPGPSQLKLELLDGKFSMGQETDSELIGLACIDLEDRWFCQDWRDTKYKPREVRDLTNEQLLPGVSQGKLSLFIDMVDQNKAEENPIEDIQVLGKTLNMEMRVIIWNTIDTAPKDSYTSDVYISCEMLGVGDPKNTDTHYSVKVKAYGMFNYRLKWRCKYPDMNLEYLMRIGIWDENALTSHQCIAEGVLPIRKLFKDCFERNQGKTSPDEMEFVFLNPRDVGQDIDPDSQVKLDEDKAKYPFVQLNMVHPNMGFDPKKNAQAKLQLSLQVMPRAKAKASPAGSKRYGPSKLPEPGRPPQPANPIFEPEKCKAYIVYSIGEFFSSCRGPCMCLCCILCVVAIIALLVGLQQSGLGAMLGLPAA